MTVQLAVSNFWREILLMCYDQYDLRLKSDRAKEQKKKNRFLAICSTPETDTVDV